MPPPATGSPRWIDQFADLFAYPLRMSHYIEMANPLWSSHRLLARVVRVADDSGHTCLVTLRPGRIWPGHHAGQVVRVGFWVHGVRLVRTCAIASPPGRTSDVVIAVRNDAEAFQPTRHVQVGSYLTLGLPQGSFHAMAAQAHRLLFITAADGITPAMCLARHLAGQDRPLDCVHLHLADNDADGSSAAGLAQRTPGYRFLMIGTGMSDGQAPGADGRNDGWLDRACPDWREREAFACGPPARLGPLTEGFRLAGRIGRLHLEPLSNDCAPPAAGMGPNRVRFAASRIDAQADPTSSLMSIAQAAGLKPPRGCGIGICHTCKIRLISGCVRDLRTGELRRERDTLVQTCINAAAGDCELDL